MNYLTTIMNSFNIELLSEILIGVSLVVVLIITKPRIVDRWKNQV